MNSTSLSAMHSACMRRIWLRKARASCCPLARKNDSPVLPLRGGGQKHELGIGEFHWDPPFGWRRRACRHHRSPAVGVKPAGQDPGSTKGALQEHQQSRSVCSGNPVLCARKTGFVGCFSRGQQLLVATRRSFSKDAFQNDICRFESSMPSQPVRSLLFDFRLCANCRHSRLGFRLQDYSPCQQ
jgi:hypothetical protein